MKTASKRPQLIPSIILMLAVVFLLNLAGQAGAAKKEKEEGFLNYLFEILSADEVPSPPSLSAEDRQAMDKLEILLKAQNQRAPDGGNFVLLGALAAAKNDICGASSYLDKARCQMPNSPLPATMAAQVYVQAGDFQRAKALHCQALRKVGNTCRAPALGANSHMDLAVTYAQSGDKMTAWQQLRKAEAILIRQSRDPAQAALGWLQMGIVYADSMDDDNVALCAWKNGSNALACAVTDEHTASLKLDLDVRIADTLIAAGNHQEAAVYLQSASQVVVFLSEYKRPEARFQIGGSYVELAQQNPDVGAYAEKAAEQLAALTAEDTPAAGTLGAHRDAALAHAKLIKESNPDEANRLIAKALQWTLEIGQLDSAYAPVFDHQALAAPPVSDLDLHLLQDSFGSDGQ